ncbi:MAG: S-adenosylmethionine:tRNA ribosyltransferase-isomerase [Caldilineaceae bacterium]
MKSTELYFERPETLNATMPAEARGLQRDEVRLLVSTASGHTHARFEDLPRFLRPGDLLVVNRSATLPASLPARNASMDFMLNLSTHYGHNLWLTEPRWGSNRPGPLPLVAGQAVAVGDGLIGHWVAPHPGLPRLWFAQFAEDLAPVMHRLGAPIRYGYVNERYGLDAYQTVFATEPGSAEMPSAARPFTLRVLQELQARGVGLAEITLHTGVSSHEVETTEVEQQTLYAEPFQVPAATAQAVNDARCAGRRVIAVGTTVVRALESAWDGRQVRACRGFTRLYIHPGRSVHTVNGIISGLHDSMASHLAMLYAIAGAGLIRSAYEEAVREVYLWHEFGDSHLVIGGRGNYLA